MILGHVVMAGLLWLQFGVESLAIVWLACLANEMEKGKRKREEASVKTYRTDTEKARPRGLHPTVRGWS